MHQPVSSNTKWNINTQVNYIQQTCSKKIFPPFVLENLIMCGCPLANSTPFPISVLTWSLLFPPAASTLKATRIPPPLLISTDMYSCGFWKIKSRIRCWNHTASCLCICCTRAKDIISCGTDVTVDILQSVNQVLVMAISARNQESK